LGEKLVSGVTWRRTKKILIVTEDSHTEKKAEVAGSIERFLLQDYRLLKHSMNGE